MIDGVKLYNSLKELGIISEDKLEELLVNSKKEGSDFAEYLLEKDVISDENLGKVIADIYELSFINLRQSGIDKEIFFIIPEVFARANELVAFKKDENGLHVASANPQNVKAFELLAKKTGDEIKKYYATKRDVMEAFSLYKKDISKAFEDLVHISQENEDKKEKELSIIKIVETIISYAYQNKSSDIHIEPQDDKTIIRFRIDGILHDVLDVPKTIHDQIVTRIKVLSKLRTDEHASAQDGKMVVEVEGEDLDIRVSVVPITDGEKVVMRLLSERSRRFSLEDLGFAKNDLSKIESAYKKPHGMILVTGPTGSGKTTTLYALLKLLNSRNINIMTIEDPVEYDIEGINQIQVNPKTKLNFAHGLRSIVRQDPDVILVGEIRDEETADISINAAMTGHLVLSSLHTNDAATSIPRLFDLGVEPFLVGSTVNIIIAQRLVRKICSSCRVSEEISLDSLSSEKKDSASAGIFSISDQMLGKVFGSSKKARVYSGKGCKVCHNTGYVGRVGIFEILVVDDDVRNAIDEKKDALQIAKIAIGSGMRTMLENGLEKVRDGITSMNEILRVTKE